MKDERINPMLMLLMMILLMTDTALTMCPSRCSCSDETLRAICVEASLEVVPIQLNPDMHYIDLTLNKIYDVYFTLSFYHSLVSLNLSWNKIHRLGNANFDSLPYLKHLNLSHNQIQTLTKDTFKGLNNLTDLDLSFNRLEEIAAIVFRDLHSLNMLKLSNNQLVYLEAGVFSHSKKLYELFLDDNQFLEIPFAALTHATSAKIISLSRNLIAIIQNGDLPLLSELRTLLLDTNVINTIRPRAFSGVSKLKDLDLSDNNFTSIPTTSLAKLSNLTKFYFNGNFICSVPPVAFRGLFELRYLQLNRLDMLTHIDIRAFVDNVNLERVYFDNNIVLHNLPVRLFHGNPRVSHVSVRNSQLETLEVLHFPLDQLKSLRLGGNPFQCNCSLLWLWRLLQEQNGKEHSVNDTRADFYIDRDYIRCAGPETLANVLLMDASESQVDCSLTWVAAICAALFACLLLATTITLLYFGPVKRRLNKRELPPRETTPHSDSATLNHPYEESHVDKFIIGPSIIREYRALPSWESFAEKQNMDIFKKYNADAKPRPHIVYV